MRTKCAIATGHFSFCFPPLQQQFKIQHEATKLIFFHECIVNATHTTCSFGHFAMVSLVFLPLTPRDVAGSSIASLVPAGVLELSKQLFSSYTS
jgi:hypothetical protein